MMASRGMGVIKPSKMPSKKTIHRKGKAAGKQFVAQPKTIAKKTAGFR
jgi:hypothetical protein